MLSEYIAYFGLRETPFGRNQNPKWLYLAMQHKEMILKTRWAIETHGGLILWRGDVGHGKSSLIEYMMTAWPKQFGWNCAKLQNTGSIDGPRTLVAEILAAFGLETAPTTRKMVTQLENWLLTQACADKTMVLFIDEAQSIGSRAYPIIRDLLNLQTTERILMQIVLAGQLNIDQKLAQFPALRSRIASVATLSPFSYEEADAMLLRRLELAGATDPFNIYTPWAVKAIHAHSGGVPRDFMTLAEASMQEAFLRERRRIDAEHVEHAARNLNSRHEYVPHISVPTELPPAPMRTMNRVVVPGLQTMQRYARAA